MLYEPSRALLERWLPGTAPRAVQRLDAGFRHDLFRIDTAGGSYVLKIALPPLSIESVLCAHQWVTRIAARMPEVAAPLAAPDGSTAIMDHGRLSTLLPYVAGEHPSRFRREHRLAAAHTLARIHHAAATIPDPPPRPGFPSWQSLDWRRNQWWDWDHLRAALPNAADAPEHVHPATLATVLDRQLGVLPVAVKELAHRWPWETHPLHGDYGPRNLLIRDDRVVGVFDWDGARLDWRAWEVADGAWSFSRHVRRDDFDRAHAREFVAAYETAGGTVAPAERAYLVLLMRVRLLGEALYGLGRWQRGDEADWDEVAAYVRALESLDGVESIDEG